jgi:uncharacterized protein (TIGR03083 family)
MRYFSKNEFIEDIRKEYDNLGDLVAGLDARRMTEAGICGGGKWSVKDMLAHLHEWHRMALAWYATGLTGERAAIPTMKDAAALNQRIYEKHHDRSLAWVRRAFRESHEEMMQLIDSLSEEQLLKPGVYAWTRKNA